ncbi:TIGR02530 family flagellar biosynthesis protein [Clostridium malenominatum]|uniref:TIGR02530 family flagellar biosynthesis protein n=1 Tax=Clostridium malenominatum TaxID=1539 RepID=A0ABP3U823_9CLOT
MSYRIINGKLQYIENLQPYSNKPKVKECNNNGSCNFEQVLKKEISKDNEVTISKHATQRLLERDIKITEEDMKKINDAIDGARQKGCREGVILYKDVALIASIKNRTIITAMSKDESQGNIFTNIDSLVIL